MITQPGHDPPFLDPEPQHWAARGLWYVLLLVVAIVLVAATIVKVPDTISGRFTLVEDSAAPARLHGEMIVPETGVPLLEPGQAVQMRLDAFPYQRYGVRSGVVRSSAAAGAPLDGRPTFRARFELRDSSVQVRGRAQPLLAGMSGQADVVLGRRSLARYLFGALSEGAGEW